MKCPLSTIWSHSCVVLFLRAVHPVDGGGLSKLGHFLDPLAEVLVAG